MAGHRKPPELIRSNNLKILCDMEKEILKRLMKNKCENSLEYGLVVKLDDACNIIDNASEGNPANSENANCAIFGVSNRRELLIAFLTMREGHSIDSNDIKLIDTYLEGKSNYSC